MASPSDRAARFPRRRTPNRDSQIDNEDRIEILLLHPSNTAYVNVTLRENLRPEHPLSGMIEDDSSCLARSRPKRRVS